MQIIGHVPTERRILVLRRTAILDNQDHYTAIAFSEEEAKEGLHATRGDLIICLDRCTLETMQTEILPLLAAPWKWFRTHATKFEQLTFKLDV